MSRNTGSVASSDTSWLKLYAAVAVLPLALAACGGGGGGDSPSPAPAPAPTPTPPAPAPTPTPSPAPSAGVTWTNIVATSVGNLQGVDYADSRWVAVSDSGSALTSTDGVTWTSATALSSSVGTDHLDAYAIAHSGTTFVAVGSVSSAPYTTSTGAVATSTDGSTWAMGTLPTGATPIHGVIAGTKWIGLGETGHLYSSTNGSSWSLLTTVSGPGTLNAGVYGDSKYIAVGDNGYIAASSDGTAWAAGKVITNTGGTGINMHGVAWTGTQFVAVGDSAAISTSPDGSMWSALKTSAITGTLRSVAVSSGGQIVVVGDNGIETSTDGNTWTSRDPAGAVALNAVAFANSEFVAVGATSAIKTSVTTP